MNVSRKAYMLYLEPKNLDLELLKSDDYIKNKK